MDLVDEIIDRYGLTRETTEKYVDNILYRNAQDTGKASGISRSGAYYYKQQFQKMTKAERALLVSLLMFERYLKHKKPDSEKLFNIFQYLRNKVDKKLGETQAKI